MKKLVSVFLIFTLFCSILAAGGGGEKAGQKHDVVLGTAGTAGTYYVVAAAMASAINAKSQTINVVAQPTNGSVENLNLVNAGTIEFGMSNADGVYWSSTGTGTFAAKGKQKVAGAMALYVSAGHMITKKNSGIKNYGDLKGKKVVLGPPSTTIVEMSKAVLREYGIDPEKDITPFYASFDEGLAKLLDGDVDASFFVAGVPTAALINASSQGTVDFVDISGDVVNKVSEKMPFFKPYVIPSGTYKGIDRNVNTLKIMTEIFVGTDVPEATVYEFVKQAMENLPDYAGSHVVCKEITLPTVVQVSAPLHPGAAKYYKEVGAIK